MLYTAWKHQSAFVFLVFSGVWSGNIGQKAVKPIFLGEEVYLFPIGILFIKSEPH